MCAENTHIRLMDKYVPIRAVENGKAKHLQAYGLSPWRQDKEGALIRMVQCCLCMLVRL